MNPINYSLTRTFKIMKKSIFAIFTFALFMGSNSVFAQDPSTAEHMVNVTVPEVAVLDIATSSESNIVELNPTFTGEAGTPLVFGQQNDALWLNYSSVVKANKRRTITAQLEAPIPGIDIKLTPSAITTGKGKKGTAVAGPVILSTTPSAIITEIGTCYTEDGPSNGHKLTYTITLQEADTYDQISVGETTYAPKVTYTITEAN